MKSVFAVPAVLLIALIAIAAVPGEQSQEPAGEVHNLSGNIIFTEDVTYGDGDSVFIQDGTVIDMAVFDWTIGEGSTVTLLGSVTLMSYSGTLVVGKDTTLLMFGTALLGFQEKVSYDFFGYLRFSSVLSDTDPVLSFTPMGSDDCIHISWANSEISVGNLRMYQNGTTTEYSRAFGFTSLRYSATYYDDGGIVSVRTIVVDTAGVDKVVTAAIHKDTDTADITVASLGGIVLTDTYPASSTVCTTAVTALGTTTVAVGADRFGHIVSSAGAVSLNKVVSGQTYSSLEAKDVTVSVDIDLTKLLKLIIGGITGDTPDFIRSLELGASSVKMTDADYSKDLDLKSLVLKVDPDAAAESYLTLSASSETAEYLLSSQKPSVSSYTLTQDFVLDIDCTVSTFALTVTSSGVTEKATAAGIGLQTRGMDLKSLYLLYSRTGSLAIRHILDNSDYFHMTQDALAVDRDGGGSQDITATEPDVVICKDTRGLYTLTVQFAGITGEIPAKYGKISVEASRTMLFMESTENINESIDALIGGAHFTSDAHTGIQISNSGFGIVYKTDNGTLSVTSRKTSEVSPTTSSVVLTLDHLMSTGKTALKGKLSATGYGVLFGLVRQYADPQGSLEATFLATDMAGSFDLEFGDSITYSVNLSMPLSAELHYYGIDLAADIKNATMNLNRGNLTVDGFDRNTTGILQLPGLMLVSDYTSGFRASLELTDTVVYNQGKEFKSYTDVSVESRQVNVDAKRNDRVALDLYDLRLDISRTDGTGLLKEIDHLELDLNSVKDAGSEPMLDKVMSWAIIPCILFGLLLVLYLLRLRKRDPELFRFEEIPDHEHIVADPVEPRQEMSLPRFRFGRKNDDGAPGSKMQQFRKRMQERRKNDNGDDEGKE